MRGLNDGDKYKVYKPGNSNKYRVRFSIRGQGQQRVPLGTYDESEANAKHIPINR